MAQSDLNSMHFWVNCDDFSKNPDSATFWAQGAKFEQFMICIFLLWRDNNKLRISYFPAPFRLSSNHLSANRKLRRKYLLIARFFLSNKMASFLTPKCASENVGKCSFLQFHAISVKKLPLLENHYYEVHKENFFNATM